MRKNVIKIGERSFEEKEKLFSRRSAPSGAVRSQNATYRTTGFTRGYLSSFIESILNNDQGKKELIFFCKTSGFDKHASAFTKLFKDELLKTENKDIFKNLPMEVQKAFIEQNKDDINFLSTFSNV